MGVDVKSNTREIRLRAGQVWFHTETAHMSLVLRVVAAKRMTLCLEEGEVAAIPWTVSDWSRFGWVLL